MLKLIVKLSLIGILFMGLVTSCEEDGPIVGGTPDPMEEEPLGPTIGLVADVNIISSPTDVPVGGSFTVRVSAQAGEAALKTFAVVEDGAVMPFDRLTFSDPDIGANPVLILKTDDKTSLTWDITIQASEREGNTPYTFEIVDENDKKDLVFLNITTVPAEVVPPTAFAVEEAPFFWGQKTCPPGTRFTTLINAEKGSSLIESITVLEDGIAIEDLSRIGANGDQFPANPWIFNGQDALSIEVSILTAADDNSHVYDVVISDANGEKSIVSIDVFPEATGSSLTNSFTAKLLLNQAGPAGTGGINLLTGESIGSSDEAAHLKDEGIDLSSSIASNWKRQISGVNGSTIRAIDVTQQPEGFSFENIQFKEDIISLFDTGGDLITQNDNGTFITTFVIIGDIFAVRNGENYFLVEVTNINVTEADNNDYYELSIKY